MSRNCLSGVPVEWLLLFLLLLSDLSSAGDNTYVQDETVVCTGQDAHFRWNYKVKSSLGIVWTHNEEQFASSASLSFESGVITSDHFEGRLTLNSKNPFSFTLENATDVDNGTYECVFHFDGGIADYVMGKLKVEDFHKDDSLLEKKEEDDSCVTLSCKADPPCKWIYPNGTIEVAKKIRYCLNKKSETIICESGHVCKYAQYTKCDESNSKRQRRSLNDCLGDDSNSDGTDPGAEPGADPINPVPIVLGVLVPITAIAVITVIIVFYKRRSREQGVQGPPVHYMPTPVEDN